MPVIEGHPHDAAIGMRIAPVVAGLGVSCDRAADFGQDVR
jgi:hypothetical protein